MCSALPTRPNAVDWFGDSSVNIWAALIAATWRHAGYIMVLYLAGLKGIDPTLREAAAIDGASSSQTFFRVVFPSMRPINIVVIVITVIESLRAFDIVYVINRGTNGLELIGALVVQNLVGEGQVIGSGLGPGGDAAGRLAWCPSPSTCPARSGGRTRHEQ